MCPLNLRLWSLSNFSNQPYYCMRLILVMTQRLNELEGYTVRVSHYQSDICAWMRVCVCVSVCLPVDACMQLCVKLASSSRVMIKHTHAHILTPDQTYTHTCCLSWTELKGPNWVWLWSLPQHPLFYSNTAFLLLFCLMCPSGHLCRTQVTPFLSSNKAQCALKHKGCSCCNGTLGV